MTPPQIGPYIISEEIGAGGMGTVYLAHHGETNEVAALKVLPSSMAREPGFVARFDREIESLRRLSNPHIVKFLESGNDQDTYYFAMEYIDGETLAALLKREKRLPWKQVVEIGVQICSALKSAHDMGIIHRDLKPSNLLIDDAGVVKLTDFGIAQVFATSKLTATGGIVGTAEYMSPEQADGRRATRQSDLYSLGAVLYTIVTGRTPFSGATSVEVIQKHKYGQFDRPSLIVPEIPSWLEVIICRLLEKDPEKRYPDAFVLSRQLQQVVQKVELSMRDTMDSPPTRAEVPATTVENDEPQMGGATLMKELIGQELQQLQGEHPVWELLNKTSVLVVLLILLILGGFYWFRDDQLPAEERFRAAQKILTSDESDEWLTAGEQLASLVAEDPDLWEAEASPYLAQVEMYRLKTALTRRGRKLGKQKPKSEPERLLLLAQSYRTQGDFATAEHMLSSLITLLAENDQHEDLRKLSLDLLADIREEQLQFSDASAMLDFAMERADRLAKSGELEKAKNIWRSVVALYGEQTLSDPLVRKARDSLQKYSNHSSPTNGDNGD